ncbi:hypothetical protein PGTUg99_032121 [Puccinia graminis f. sp. tritici]|uniref:Uncharacterized protein n=1 Tax=Puccinia graminis f. sp. tritici TaxID=56615 RepID=A0A5B0MJK1_PUCGR|nr:hypothetical protein PGTUg99_032121 [Puccinia graminis f. sp. tritici]
MSRQQQQQQRKPNHQLIRRNKKKTPKIEEVRNRESFKRKKRKKKKKRRAETAGVFNKKIETKVWRSGIKGEVIDARHPLVIEIIDHLRLLSPGPGLPEIEDGHEERSRAVMADKPDKSKKGGVVRSMRVRKPEIGSKGSRKEV